MKNQQLYQIGKSLGLKYYELDDLFKNKSRYFYPEQAKISVMYSNQYKAGSHYGTISMKEL